MQSIRHFLAQRHVAMLVCTAALLLKLIVPTGYMIDTGRTGFAIVACSGVAPAAAAMPMAMPGMHGAMLATTPDHAADANHGKPGEHGRAEAPCAFAGVSATMLAAVDPILLALLVAFVMLVALWPSRPPARARRAQLRPPLRGPPAYR